MKAPSNNKGLVLSSRQRVTLAETKVLHCLATMRPEMTRGEIQSYVLSSFPGEFITAVLDELVAEGRIVVETKPSPHAVGGFSPFYRINPDRASSMDGGL